MSNDINYYSMLYPEKTKVDSLSEFLLNMKISNYLFIQIFIL